MSSTTGTVVFHIGAKRTKNGLPGSLEVEMEIKLLYNHTLANGGKFLYGFVEHKGKYKLVRWDGKSGKWDTILVKALKSEDECKNYVEKNHVNWEWA